MLVLIVFLTGTNAPAQADTHDTADPLRLYLRQALSVAPGQHPASQGIQELKMARVVRTFYTRRTYRPAWSQDKILSPHVDVLVSLLQDAAREGLDPTDYHISHIVDLQTTIHSTSGQQHGASIEELGHLDLLLTDAFLLYGSHLLHGRVSPRGENGVWGLQPDNMDLATTLQIALDRGDLASAAHDLEPTHPGYTALRQTLARYREIAASGGWPSMPPGPAIRLGSYTPRVPVLRTRLRAEGYLSHDVVTSDTVFDDSLDRAVRRFQQQQGLEEDGVVGPATREAMNTRLILAFSS
jgi:L,D-transpeptidase YcbB